MKLFRTSDILGRQASFPKKKQPNYPEPRVLSIFSHTSFRDGPVMKADRSRYLNSSDFALFTNSMIISGNSAIMIIVPSTLWQLYHTSLTDPVTNKAINHENTKKIRQISWFRGEIRKVFIIHQIFVFPYSEIISVNRKHKTVLINPAYYPRCIRAEVFHLLFWNALFHQRPSRPIA